jgi:hypothetical protein
VAPGPGASDEIPRCIARFRLRPFDFAQGSASRRSASPSCSAALTPANRLKLHLGRISVILRVHDTLRLFVTFT